MIELINLEKDYFIKGDPVKVIKGINFRINKGDFIAIMGPSGSGKTTLMNIIGLLDTATNGTYLLDDLDISTLNDNEMSELRNKKMGFIFQSFYLIQYLNILENVMLPVYYSENNPSKYVKRAHTLLGDFGLLTKLKNKPNQLSGGQQQRVAVARALASTPSFVLADEPTANLDSVSAESLLDLMENLNQKHNMTFVFSTHDQRVINRAHRVVTLQDGKIKSDKLNPINIKNEN